MATASSEEKAEEVKNIAMYANQPSERKWISAGKADIVLHIKERRRNEDLSKNLRKVKSV